MTVNFEYSTDSKWLIGVLRLLTCKVITGGQGVFRDRDLGIILGVIRENGEISGVIRDMNKCP